MLCFMENSLLRCSWLELRAPLLHLLLLLGGPPQLRLQLFSLSLQLLLLLQQRLVSCSHSLQRQLAFKVALLCLGQRELHISELQGRRGRVT